MLKIPENALRDILIKDGVVTDEQFEDALKQAKRMEQSVDDVLVSRALITEAYLNTVLVDYFGVEKANLTAQAIDENVMRLLSEDIARQKRVLVFNREPEGTLNVAMEDPNNLATIEFLQSHLKSRIRPFLASREDLNRGFALYGKRSAEEFKKIIQENIKSTLQSRAKGIKEAAVELPVVAIVDNLVSYAIALRASDIHIEPLEADILVRYRIDGVLQEIVRISKEVLPSIVARIKLLANLKLDEHSKPQDGRFRYKLGEDFLDVRVAIMPVFYGEKVELRLLSGAERPLSLQELGMLDWATKLLLDNARKTFGMLLITGPTGAGKTTTMYAVLNILNRPEVNIVTVEDPIEYDIKYVNQTQINPEAGISFAEGLRSLLRQDPNIIMVGEIRDPETADISVQAALTGHLLLSSLHTNNAVTAIPRLFDMKIPPFLVAAVLNMVAAQRLVRRLCADCMVSHEIDEQTTAAIKEQFKEAAIPSEKQKIPRVLYKGLGCPACGETGYRGRMLIFEALDISENMRRVIADPAFTLAKLTDAARKEGMVTMLEDGLMKAQRGMTTIEEVLRVIRE